MLLRLGSVRMHNHPKEPPKGLGLGVVYKGAFPAKIYSCNALFR